MKKILFVCLAVLTTIVGCRQYEIVAEAPDFEVTTDKQEYAVGEPISFNFSGDPDMITFYSGEIKSDYNFREGRTVAQGRLTMSFNHAMAYGNRTDQASLYVSTDFNGNYSSIEDIKRANWVPITDRIVDMPTPNIGGPAYVYSGEIQLNDLIEEGKPLYIAFKYEDDPSRLPSTPVNYIVQNFKVESETELGIEQLVGLTGWQLVYEGEKEPTRSAVSAATITLRGNSNPPGVHHTVDWCISQPIPTGQVDLGPDRPLSVKGSRQTDVTNFVYEYDMPGTYEAYFVARNANINGSAETVRKIELTITSEDAGGEFGFDVVTDKVEYQVGETVVFNFEGKTDVINFYSGEFGNDYMYRDGRIMEPDAVNVSFGTRRANVGSAPVTLWVSTEFNGDFTGSNADRVNNVNQGNWTEIPFPLPPGTATTPDYLSSENLDLMPYRVINSDMYIAFRYVDNTSVYTGNAAWFIRDLKIEAQFALGAQQLPITINSTGSDWLGFAFDYPNGFAKQAERSQFMVTGSGAAAHPIIRFFGNNGVAPNLRPTSDGAEWVVSRGFRINDVDLGPDQAIEVRNPWADTHYHAHVYTQSGVYHVYFIGKRGSREIVRKVEITVLP